MVPQDLRSENRLRVQAAPELRSAFLPPISDGRKRRLLAMIPGGQASVFGWVVDGDPFCLHLRSLGLRQNDLKNAVLERGLDLVFINVHADRNLPFEAAVETFAELALLVLRLGFHLAANDQIAVVQENLDVFFLHAGDFRRDRNLFFGFGDLELRPGGVHETRPAPGKRSRGEAAKGFFQKAVHFTVQCEKRARSFVAEKLREEILAPGPMILTPGPRNEITHVHGLFSKGLSGHTVRETLPRSAFPAKIAAGFRPYDIVRLAAWRGRWRPSNRTPPDHGAGIRGCDHGCHVEACGCAFY